METIKMRARTDHNGILRLEAPMGLSDALFDVVLVATKVANEAEARAEWLAFIDRMAGSLADNPIERPPQGDYEEREPIE